MGKMCDNDNIAMIRTEREVSLQVSLVFRAWTKVLEHLSSNTRRNNSQSRPEG